MVEGNAFITFGSDTTFMIGGSGTYNDEPAVSMFFRSREPGPIRKSEEEIYKQDTINSSDYNLTMVFTSVKSIDKLIGNLNIVRENLEQHLKEAEQ